MEKGWSEYEVLAPILLFSLLPFKPGMVVQSHTFGLRFNRAKCQVLPWGHTKPLQLQAGQRGWKGPGGAEHQPRCGATRPRAPGLSQSLQAFKRRVDVCGLVLIEWLDLMTLKVFSKLECFSDSTFLQCQALDVPDVTWGSASCSWCPLCVAWRIPGITARPWEGSVCNSVWQEAEQSDFNWPLTL